jgi:hypothetical protein
MKDIFGTISGVLEHSKKQIMNLGNKNNIKIWIMSEKLKQYFILLETKMNLITIINKN